MIPAEQKILVKAEKNSLIPTKNTCKIVQGFYIKCKGHDFTLHFNLTLLKTNVLTNLAWEVQHQDDQVVRSGDVKIQEIVNDSLNGCQN